MHGARKLALDHALSLNWAQGAVVLDLGAGDGEIAKALREKGVTVRAVDFDPQKSHTLIDITDVPWGFRDREYDAVIACYTLQHLLGDEASVWREIRRALKPDGYLIMTGRYREEIPSFEMERGDPLRQDNEASLIALAQASGLRLTWIKTYSYSEKGYQISGSRQSANAFAATFKKAGSYGLPWDEAVKRYRLFEVEGWMWEEELRFLYETAKAMGGGTVVEIGSFMGRSTCAILAGLAEGRGGRLVVVDTFAGKGGSREAEVAANGGPEWVKLNFLTNIKSRGLPTPFIYQGDSKEVWEKFRRESIEWLFVDGDHTYDGLYEDLRCWVQNVKPNGLISGHDYHETWPSVVSAVTDYFKVASSSYPRVMREPYKVTAAPGTSIWTVRR